MSCAVVGDGCFHFCLFYFLRQDAGSIADMPAFFGLILSYWTGRMLSVYAVISCCSLIPALYIHCCFMFGLLTRLCTLKGTNQTTFSHTRGHMGGKKIDEALKCT